MEDCKMVFHRNQTPPSPLLESVYHVFVYSIAVVSGILRDSAALSSLVRVQENIGDRLWGESECEIDIVYVKT